MTAEMECRYYGRDFTVEEMALLRALIAGLPALNRFALSKEFCRRIGWYKPDGGLKDMMARVAMLAMHRDGRIALPPPKWGRNPAVPITFGPETDAPLEPPPVTLDEARPIRLRTVLGATPQSKQWNAFIARYHYLGYKTLVGAQMRYTVHDRHGRLLALLGFSTAARTLAPRDRFIGWTPALRQKNLPLVIDNARFLILPWIRIPNLGLAHPVRRLPTTARGVDRALQHLAGVDRNLRGDPALHRRHLQSLRVGPRRHHPGDAGATTATNSTTSRKRTSGFAPSERTGNEPSTGRSSEHRSGYQPSLACTALTESAKISVIYPRLTERLPPSTPE